MESMPFHDQFYTKEEQFIINTYMLTSNEKFKKLDKIRNQYRDDIEIAKAFLNISYEPEEQNKIYERIRLDLEKIVRLGFYILYSISLNGPVYDKQMKIYLKDKENLSNICRLELKKRNLEAFVQMVSPTKLVENCEKSCEDLPKKFEIYQFITDADLNSDDFNNMMDIQKLMYLRKLRCLYYKLSCYGAVIPDLSYNICDSEISQYISFLLNEKGVDVSKQVKYLTKEEQIENIDWFFKKNFPNQATNNNDERLNYLKQCAKGALKYDDFTEEECKEYIKCLKHRKEKVNVRKRRFS